MHECECFHTSLCTKKEIRERSEKKPARWNPKSYKTVTKKTKKNKWDTNDLSFKDNREGNNKKSPVGGVME